MKQLERLLFLQGNRCFFCGHAIPIGEASIEHLVAAANGGLKDDENCVVCCKAVNLALGHLSVKAKLRAILNHGGRFACPAVPTESAPASQASTAAGSSNGRLALVVADLRKRGSARPRRLATLKNTVNAVFRMSLTDEELDVLVTDLSRSGYISVDETKVSYALPAAGA